MSDIEENMMKLNYNNEKNVRSLVRENFKPIIDNRVLENWLGRGCTSFIFIMFIIIFMFGIIALILFS